MSSVLQWVMVGAVTLGTAGCAPAGPIAQAAPRSSTHVSIDTMAIRAHTFFLSNDRLRGRATEDPGAEWAALYIASVCRSLGLTPIGATFDLPVPLATSSVSGSKLTVQVGDRRGTFSAPGDLIVRGGTTSALRDFRGPAVLVGRSEDVIAGRTPPVAGAVAVTLGVVESNAAVDSLAARGAVGMIHLTSDQAAFDAYEEREGSNVTVVTDSAVRSSYHPNLPSIVASPAASRLLVAGRLNGLEPGPMGATIDMQLRLALRPVAARNVGCQLHASGTTGDSAIVLTAHYDHLGVGQPDASGDSIYNGFSDNAAGVAMLLAIAEAMGREARPPTHSIVFLFFTGEERGLLGSDYYVTRPDWPVRKILGVINLDAGAPPGLVWSWRIAGGDSSRLGRLAVDVALSRGWSAVTSGPRANSDYYPFFRMGVPAIFLVPGPAPYEGLSADSSQALRRRWDHYHQAADEWRDDFPFSGLARYAEYALLIARALDRGLGERR